MNKKNDKFQSDLKIVVSLISEPNFNVSHFLRSIDKKLKTKKICEIWDEIIHCWSKQLSKKKLNQKYKKLNNHLNRDVRLYLFESGELLPLIEKNFKLIKVIELNTLIFDGDFEKNYVYQIIKSEINNTFYILLSEDILMVDHFTLRCVNKTKDKRDAINFIKKNIKYFKSEDKINRKFRNK